MEHDDVREGLRVAPVDPHRSLGTLRHQQPQRPGSRQRRTRRAGGSASRSPAGRLPADGRCPGPRRSTISGCCPSPTARPAPPPRRRRAARHARGAAGTRGVPHSCRSRRKASKSRIVRSLGVGAPSCDPIAARHRTSTFARSHAPSRLIPSSDHRRSSNVRSARAGQAFRPRRPFPRQPAESQVGNNLALCSASNYGIVSGTARPTRTSRRRKFSRS